MQYSHHDLLSTAGKAILGTNFSIPALRFVSYWWGCKVAAEDQQPVRDAFPKFQKLTLQSALSSAPNNCTVTISCWKLPSKLRTKIPCVYKIHMTDFKLKSVLLDCALHTSCHATWNNILWNSAAKTTLETCIHPNESWEYRMVHLKMLLPFLRIFTKPKGIPYYMDSSSTASVKMWETSFHVWFWLVFSCDCRWS